MLNQQIFREYDIRGVADRDLSDANVFRISRAIGSFLWREGQRRIALGRDCRLSSPRIHIAMKEGLRDVGLHIVDIGVVPTPMAYFAVHHLSLDGVVQITGSHNPPADNGVKMMSGKDTLYGASIAAIRDTALSGDFEQHPGAHEETVDLLEDYIAVLRKALRTIDTSLKVAVDGGNGAGGPTLVAVLQALGVSVVPLLCEMDGNFPVHEADPTVAKNLELLVKEVQENGCDVGIALDGDGDRLGVVDRDGTIVWGDRLLTLFARQVLKEHPGASIIGEVKCSQTLYEDIARHGGNPIIWQTGHSLIKKKMKDEKAPLAGEMSGHMFFADRYFGYDDATYACCRLLEIITESGGRSVSELLADLPQTSITPELRIPCADRIKFAVVERVAKYFQERYEVLTLDGARIHFDGGWGLIRASNTQPCLVMRFEATDQQSVERFQTDVEAQVALALKALET